VAICKSAGGFVSGVCLIVLVPIFQTIIAGGLWGACLIVMVYLVSSATFVTSSSYYFSYIGDYSDIGLQRFYAFVFFTLWTSAFVGAMTTFVVASACCLWYYSHGPDQ
jgi:solute carrier family 44 protein 1 (choline transporter-like protein)/choline transporter-like protein 2/4/5